MSVIETAQQIIHGDREKTYGHPARNLNKIADQWTLYLHQKYGATVPINAEDVCYMMADLKKVRQMHQHKSDNLVDGIGYLGLVERVYEDTTGKESRPSPTA